MVLYYVRKRKNMQGTPIPGFSGVRMFGTTDYRYKRTVKTEAEARAAKRRFVKKGGFSGNMKIIRTPKGNYQIWEHR